MVAQWIYLNKPKCICAEFTYLEFFATKGTLHIAIVNQSTPWCHHIKLINITRSTTYYGEIEDNELLNNSNYSYKGIIGNSDL